MLIVWDCKTLLPVRTFSGIFGPGVLRSDFSDDGALIAILTGQSTDFVQKLQILEWAAPGNTPLVETEIPTRFGL